MPRSRPLLLPAPWRQGEHMVLVGDTGTGKSTLAAALLDDTWDYWVAIRVKADDVTYPGAHKTRDPRAIEDPRYPRILLDLSKMWPEEQYAAILRAFELVWATSGSRVGSGRGGWTLCLDEMYYLDSMLKGQVRTWMTRFFTQGRSLGITMMAGLQRPAAAAGSQVSRFAMSQATHLVVFNQEGRDAKVIGEAANKSLEEVVQGLGRHQFAWFYRPDRSIWTGRLQDLQE